MFKLYFYHLLILSTVYTSLFAENTMEVNEIMDIGYLEDSNWNHWYFRYMTADRYYHYFITDSYFVVIFLSLVT